MLELGFGIVPRRWGYREPASLGSRATGGVTRRIVAMARGMQRNPEIVVAEGQVALVVGDGGIVASQPFTDFQRQAV